MKGDYTCWVSVTTDDSSKMARAAEAFARTAAGLALDGTDVILRFGVDDGENDDMD